MISIKRLTLGIANTNAYLIGDTETGNAILIDPVDEAPLIHQTAQAEGWTIKLILATHAHFDHVLASRELKSMTAAKFLIHEKAVPGLASLPEWGKRFGLNNITEAATPDELLTDESQVIELDGIALKTLYTPGHAPGHVSFYLESEGIVFCGDTIFAGSIGRTDLPGASYEVLMASIFNVLLPLGDDVQLYPGHMQPTTIGRERETNPFLLSHEGADF